MSVGVVTIRAAENSRQTLVVCHFVKFSVFYSRSANLDSCRTRFRKKNASRDLRSAPANLRPRGELKRISLMGSRRGDQLRAAPISGSFDSGHAAFTVRTSLLWARASALERMADATRHTTSLGKVEGVVALDVNLVGWWNLARKRRLWSRSIRAVFLCARRSARPQPHRQTTSRRQRHSVRAP